MTKCCEVTFRKTIEEVLITIQHCNIKTIEDLKATLEYAVKQLLKKEKLAEEKK